jgi:hypothetical protein
MVGNPDSQPTGARKVPFMRQKIEVRYLAGMAAGVIRDVRRGLARRCAPWSLRAHAMASAQRFRDDSEL